MIIEYKLKENDILQLSLFSFKERNNIQKIIIKRLVTWLVICLIIILTLFLNNQYFFAIAISIGAIIGLIINPSRIKEIYFKTLKKNISLYSNIIDKIFILEINDKYMKITGYDSETKIDISAIDKIIETSQHFFIKLNPESIIIPKSEIENHNFIKNELIALAEKQKIVFENQLNWKW